MKNKAIILSVALVCAATFTIKAQIKSKFSYEVGINYNNTTNLKPREWGGGLFFNPKYSLTDNFKVGLKLQGDFLWDRAVSTSGNKPYSMDVITLFQATADYSFGTGKVKPYVSIATGSYEQHFIKSAGINQTIYDTDKGQSVGISPSAGIAISRWSLQGTYNMSVRKNTPKYLTIGVGYSIGRR
jgi:hypothetical protein